MKGRRHVVGWSNPSVTVLADGSTQDTTVPCYGGLGSGWQSKRWVLEQVGYTAVGGGEVTVAVDRLTADGFDLVYPSDAERAAGNDDKTTGNTIYTIPGQPLPVGSPLPASWGGDVRLKYTNRSGAGHRIGGYLVFREATAAELRC